MKDLIGHDRMGDALDVQGPGILAFHDVLHQGVRGMADGDFPRLGTALQAGG